MAMCSAGGWLVADDPQIVSPKLLSSLEVIMPVEVRALTFSPRSARFLARVNADGKVIDGVCLEAPHFALVEPAREALMEAQFQPGRKDGVPSMLDIEIDVQFYIPGADQTAHQSTLDHLESMQHQMNPDGHRYELCKANELDAPVAVVERGSQFVPEDSDGRRLGGSAVIECIIDHMGVPRMFRLIRSDHPEVARSALLSIQSMRFAPPRRAGHPVSVKVRIPMSFIAPEDE